MRGPLNKTVQIAPISGDQASIEKSLALALVLALALALLCNG